LLGMVDFPFYSALSSRNSTMRSFSKGSVHSDSLFTLSKLVFCFACCNFQPLHTALGISNPASQDMIGLPTKNWLYLCTRKLYARPEILYPCQSFAISKYPSLSLPPQHSKGHSRKRGRGRGRRRGRTKKKGEN